MLARRVKGEQREAFAMPVREQVDQIAALQQLAGAPPYDLRGTLHFAAGVYRVTDAKGRVGRSEVEGDFEIMRCRHAKQYCTKGCRAESKFHRGINLAALHCVTSAMGGLNLRR